MLLCYGLRGRLQATLPQSMSVDATAAVGAASGGSQPLLGHDTSAAAATLEASIREMLCALDVSPACLQPVLKVGIKLMPREYDSVLEQKIASRRQGDNNSDFGH